MNSGFTAQFFADTRPITTALKKIEQQTLHVKVDMQGNKQVEQINKSYKDLNNNMLINEKTIRKWNARTGEWDTTVQRTAKSVKTFGQDITDTFGKVMKFAAITAVIGAMTTAFAQAIEVVKEFDSAFTEMAKVSTKSREELKAYTQELGELGTEVARTQTTMTELATNFIKAGMADEADKLAVLAAKYQNTADEELTAAEATSVLVSQMKAFDYETAQQAEHITDSINNVSQNFAVSSADIGKGLTQAGASLKTYGNDFDETVGLLTAGTEIFQGKSQQVARG